MYAAHRRKKMKRVIRSQPLARNPLQLLSKNLKAPRKTSQKMQFIHLHLPWMKKKLYSKPLEERTRKMMEESSRMKMMRLLKLLLTPTSKSSDTMVIGHSSLQYLLSLHLSSILKLNMLISLENGLTKARMFNLQIITSTHSKLQKLFLELLLVTVLDNTLLDVSFHIPWKECTKKSFKRLSELQ